LREGALIAFDTNTHKERQLADRVLDFAASRAGTQIALVRDLGKGDASNTGIDLWVVARDGSNLSQLTTDGYDLVEATPSWSPDGLVIAFAAAGVSDAYARSWPDWSLWCTASTIHLLDLQTNADQSLGRGCDPAISPDGRRIAYAAPPTKFEPELNNGPTIVNSLRLINQQGENGWNFAKADGADAPPPHTGRLVYAPSWSLDGKQIVYHRFLGYQALVDLDMTEIAGSLEGKGKPLSDGAGWLLPARFAPDGQSVAITENNAGDPRGFGGYDNWSVSVTTLDGTHDIALPTGTLKAVGQRVGLLPRGQSAAWSPDGAALAVELPPGWNPRLAPDQPVDAEGQPGEIWRWRPGRAPEQLLVKNVDFASPLAWLPPAP
jgi:dipeptidyl aminopeptidase/acylaminoacyl peptidase